jgi:hypothetical protein
MELDIEKMSETELWGYVESLRDNGDLRKGCDIVTRLQLKKRNFNYSQMIKNQKINYKEKNKCQAIIIQKEF